MAVIIAFWIQFSLPAAPPAAEIPTQEIVVVAARLPGQDSSADSSQIDGERLRRSARPSAIEAISQEAADVYVSSRGAGIHGIASGASGSINIRGLGGSPNTQVLVVEDGVPDYQGIFGHPIPDAYTPFLIEDVRVVKGGDSVLWGTNAMGGVVLIKNRWLHRDGLEITNDTGFGSYQSLRENAAVLWRRGDWDIAGALSVLRTDGQRVGAGGANVIGVVGARLRLLPELRLSLSNKLLHLTGEDPGPASHPNDDHWYDVWRDSPSLRLDYDGENYSLRLVPYFHIGIHRLYDGFYSQDYLGGGNLVCDFDLIEGFKLKLGAAGEWVDGLVEDRIAREHQPVDPSGNLSVYGQLTYTPAESLTLMAGARGMYHTSYGAIGLYKAGARWEFTQGFFLRSRLSRNFRQPTLRELYLPFPTANPDLKPEYALNWDFGLVFERGRFSLAASGFRTAAENLIKYFGAWPSAEVVNIDQITVWGISAQMALEKLGPLDVRLSGEWQNVGRYTRQNPEGRLTFTVDWLHAFGAHTIMAALSGEWVHGLFMGNYGRDPIPDVFYIDLSARYRYSPADARFVVEPYLVLANPLDRRYAYIKDYPMPGFHVLAGLMVKI
ncbi:MAG TPA: TonB-dependent receptor [Myxococcota bacterium]|nr:TonB-dependent receptor [Myxococcota bacterium]